MKMNHPSARADVVMKQRPVLLALLGPLLFAGAGEALAQDLDSLHAVWQDGSRSDSVRVDAFTDYIVEGFLFTEPDSALVLTGTLRSFGDIYGRDAPVLASLDAPRVANRPRITDEEVIQLLDDPRARMRLSVEKLLQEDLRD